MDRIQAMQIFVRIADNGSFSRAAELLQLPRATVSTLISQLEAHLGVRLLHRTTRKVTLTVDGTHYYEHCMRLLADLEEMEGRFQQTASNPKGRLKVDVPGRLARLILIPALPAFLQRYPHIELELGVSDRPIDLIQEGVDCVVRVGDLVDSRLVARKAGMLRQRNFASPAYLSQHGTPQTLEDLHHHWAVNYASPLTGKVYDWEYVEAGSIRTLPMRSRITVNNAEAYMASALAGLGMIQAPDYDSVDALARGELVEVLPGFPPPAMPVSVIYPHRRHLSQRVRAFSDWVCEQLARCPGIQP